MRLLGGSALGLIKAFLSGFSAVKPSANQAPSVFFEKRGSGRNKQGDPLCPLLLWCSEKTSPWFEAAANAALWGVCVCVQGGGGVRMGRDGVYGPGGGGEASRGNVRQMVFEQVLIQMAAHRFSGHCGGGGGGRGGKGRGGGGRGGGLAKAWTH